MKGILWNKFLDRVEESGLYFVLVFLLKITMFLCIVSVFVYPEKVTTILIQLWEYKEYLFAKMFCSAIFCFYSDKIFRFTVTFHCNIFRFISKLFQRIETNIDYSTKEIQEEKSNNSSVVGIPILELIDHLFTFKTFKRDDIENRFMVPRRKYDKLAKLLESNGVIYKDPTQNNARVLTDGISREDVAILISSDGEFIKEGSDNTYNLSPTLFASNKIVK